jgi:hypothetical protein
MQIPEHESGDTKIERRDSASASIEPMRPEELGAPAAIEPAPAGRAVQRLVAAWGHTLVTGILVAAAIGLIWIASHATRPRQELGSGESLGGGIVVRYELLDLWLPETVIELAREPFRAQAVGDHQDLKRLLELRNQQDLWYALTARGHQVNGGFVDLTVIRRPYHDPKCYSEFRAVLATAGGDPPREPDSDFSTASIHLIPAELATREPRGAIAELLGQPRAPAAQGRAR